jgi:glycosyltransferase involved in cell wall biosynthesis
VRIGIDARELCGHRTGVGRYLGGLVNAWSSNDGARRHEFVLYAHQPLGIPLDARRFPARVVAGAGGTRWEQRQLPAVVARDHLDVFFAPGYTAPLFSRIPLVVAIHDVSFTAHPEWFSAREGLRRRVLTRRTAAVARAVTTLSEFSKRELMDLLNVPEAKIHIIRPGITQSSNLQSLTSNLPPSLAREHASFGEARRTAPRILYVGSIFNRRHVPDLIKAFGVVARRHREVQLDLVGEDRTHPREDIVAAIARERTDDRVRWHQYVSETQLDTLYRSAHAFAFLSEYEGLGLTPLEALASGVPSVLLDTPVARESCGPAALYVKKHDIAGTAAALEQLLFDDAVRDTLLREAPAVLARYDWDRAARETLAVLEGAQ